MQATVLAVKVLASLAVLLFLVVATNAEDRLDSSVRQLIVGIDPTWNGMHGVLQRFGRASQEWKPVGRPVPVLFGRHGLAWGRGVLTGRGTGPIKVEHDNRAPAGVFKIGLIYTYDQALPPGADYPFRTVGAADAWVDDVASPDYNRHVLVDPANPPAWFSKARMRQGDFAYRWLIEILHNADPPIPGYGSAIFFHIRRGPDRPSAGCTTMAEQDLISLIRWMRAAENPHYACLPRSEYLALWQKWDLPDPAVTGLF